MLCCHQMTESEKQEVCSWKYEGEYAVYNLPDYKTMQEKQMGFCNPKRDKNFFSYYDGEVLVGFTNLLEEESGVFVGIGVSPGKPLYLEVRCWNRRAVACYERAGFAIEGQPFRQTTSMGKGSFYRMVCPAE